MAVCATVLGVGGWAASADAATSLPPLTVAVSTSNTTASGTLPMVQSTMYAVTYIFTDTANAKLTGVSFSDSLPAGMSVAPGSTANALNCGSFQPKSESGATTISASGFTVYGNSPNHCAMEFFVVASAVEGTSSDTPGTIDWTDDGTPEPSSDVVFPSWSVAVTSAPTMTITAPVNGASLAFNQKVDAQLEATAGAGDAITPGNLYAVDEEGTEITSGQSIPTDIPGRHTLTVWAQTLDGFYGSGQTISYTVGSPRPVNLVSHPLGSLSYDIKYLATGRVTATVRHGSTVIGSARKWVHVGYETPMWISPNAAAKRLLKQHRGGIRATLTLEYQAWNYNSFRDTPLNVVPNIMIN